MYEKSGFSLLEKLQENLWLFRTYSTCIWANLDNYTPKYLEHVICMPRGFEKEKKSKKKYNHRVQQGSHLWKIWIFKRIWSTWNWTLHKFLRKNIQAGISNMEAIHELMLRNDTCAFRVHMTAVLIQKHHYSGVHRGSKFIHFDKSRVKISQNHTSKLDKVFLKLPPSSDFALEARIFDVKG